MHFSTTEIFTRFSQHTCTGTRHFTTASHITTPLTTAALSLPLRRIHTTGEQLTKYFRRQKSRQCPPAGRATAAVPTATKPERCPHLSALPATLRSLQKLPAGPQCACAALRQPPWRRWRPAEAWPRAGGGAGPGSAR